MKGRSLWKDSRQRSIEEREEEYEKVRARIFSQVIYSVAMLYFRLP